MSFSWLSLYPPPVTVKSKIQTLSSRTAYFSVSDLSCLFRTPGPCSVAPAAACRRHHSGPGIYMFFSVFSHLFRRFFHFSQYTSLSFVHTFRFCVCRPLFSVILYLFQPLDQPESCIFIRYIHVPSRQPPPSPPPRCRSRCLLCSRHRRL